MAKKQSTEQGLSIPYIWFLAFFIILGIILSLNTRMNEKILEAESAGYSDAIKENFTVFNIVCDRDDQEKEFTVLIPSSFDDYQQEQAVREYCEEFTNDDEMWNLNQRKM